MADQLQEMLNKIYEEGVNKAKEEAGKILDSANKEAEQTKTDAKLEAEKIVKEAQRKAADLEKKINSDLKMASQQAISALKNKIVNTLINKSIDKPSADSLQDTAFLKQVIIEVLGKWSPNSSMNLTVPENKRKELESFFSSSAKEIFSGELNIEYSPELKLGISIAPVDGTYKISFTDEDFANFFKSYLRPKAVEILFGD